MRPTALLLFLVSAAVGQYCNSGPSSSSDTNLGPVNLVGETSGISDNSDCPKTIGPKDLTNLVADVSSGKSYTLNFSITACGYVYQFVVGAWADYNKNGLFEETEKLFSVMGSTSGVYTQNFTVPKLDTRGLTRLRVQVQESSSPTIDPCSMFYYGATKDFSVDLRPANNYCECGPTSDQDTSLGPLIFLGEKKDIIQYANPCPGNLGPRNFTDQQAELFIGNSYTIAFSVVTCNKPYPKILSSIWIDWDANQVFDESERVLQPNARFGSIFVPVTVPANAVPGPTSMRTMVQEMVQGGVAIGPCDMFTYGATYDYPILIELP